MMGTEMSDKITLKEASKQLDKAVTDTVLYFEHLDKTDIPTLCKSYKLLHDNIKTLETVCEILSKLGTKLSHEIIPAAIESNGFDSVTVGGFVYSIGVRTFASLPDQDKGFEWLRNNGYEMLIKENVNSRTLSGAMKEYVEEKGLNPPEDIVKIHRQQYTSIRKK